MQGQLRQYCPNCFYFKPGAMAEVHEKSGYTRVLGNARYDCGKGNPSVKRLQACCYFEPWNKRAFKKYEELSELIDAQEHESAYKNKLLEQKNEIADYLKVINIDLFLKLSS